RLINPGSVGMPYQDPGAFWALLDTQVTLRRTDYDCEAAAAVIRKSAWPEAEAFARNNVLSVPSKEEVMEFFSKVGGPCAGPKTFSCAQIHRSEEHTS